MASPLYLLISLFLLWFSKTDDLLNWIKTQSAMPFSCNCIINQEKGTREWMGVLALVVKRELPHLHLFVCLCWVIYSIVELSLTKTIFVLDFGSWLQSMMSRTVSICNENLLPNDTYSTAVWAVVHLLSLHVPCRITPSRLAEWGPKLDWLFILFHPLYTIVISLGRWVVFSHLPSAAARPSTTVCLPLPTLQTIYSSRAIRPGWSLSAATNGWEAVVQWVHVTEGPPQLSTAMGFERRMPWRTCLNYWWLVQCKLCFLLAQSAASSAAGHSSIGLLLSNIARCTEGQLMTQSVSGQRWGGEP